MPPTPIITTLSIAMLDVSRHLNLNRQIPIGAAFLTTELDGLTVRFTLDSLILRPSDPVESLLTWIDMQIASGRLVAGYQLEEAARLLAQLPGAEGSPSVWALMGHGPNGLVSLSSKQADKVPCLREACVEADICTASIDFIGRFTAWVCGDTEKIELETQINVIAAFRLLLHQLTIPHSVERTIANAIGSSFEDWLRSSTLRAANVHVVNVRSTTN